MVFAIVLMIAVNFVSTVRAELIAGADMSHLVFFEQLGKSYLDNNQTNDAILILKNHGLNCIRLRLFTSSSLQAAKDPYNYINNLDYTLPLAARVKNAGLKLLLDFHYSDTWADPAHQFKPSTWTNLTFEELKTQVRLYTSNCLVKLGANNAVPDFVQIGNEITGGFLWPDGDVRNYNDTPQQWMKFGQLLKNAIAGVSDARLPKPPKILIHIDQGGNWKTARWFFDNLLQQKVEFDIIGLSYYPWWHGSFDDLQNCLTNASTRYQKPIFIVETAFPWTNSTPIFGLSASPSGQIEFIKTLIKTIKSDKTNKCFGIIWWGAEYQPLQGYNLGGYQYKSLFDHKGVVLPVVDFLGSFGSNLKLKIYYKGKEVHLKWPLSGFGLTLVRSSNLFHWTPITNEVEIGFDAFIGARITPESEPSEFYKLSSFQ